MISSQCPRRHTSVSSLILVIMIVAKFLLIFSPLLLLANAQGGGRLGFFSRPDFRRPRPWERPTIAPVPDAPAPTEKVTERITDSPRASTEWPTITPVRPTSEAPESSVSRFSRGRVWARPVFQGFRPIASSTPAAITPTDSITSSTKKPEVYVITPSSIIGPFVDNQPQYKDPNNFNSRGQNVPKITHNNDEIPFDSTKTSEKITEFTTEQTTIPSSPKVPFVDDHKRYNDIYSTTKTPIPFKMVSTSEVVSASSSRPIYQVNKNDDINIAKDSGLHLTTIPKAVTMPTTEPEVNIIIPTAKTPIIDEHKELDNGFTSHLSVEYANGFEKSSEEQSKSDGYNNPVYPVYHHETEKVSHYEQSSLSTRKPEGYTVGTSKIPFIDSHKLYENGFTPGPAIEYTNGHDKTTEIPTSKIPTDEFIQNIYPNPNYKGNDYEHLTPKVVTATQSTYQYRPPKTTTEKPVVTQTIRYTPLTTPRVTFIPTRVSNFDSSTHFPLYVSHNNVPTPGNQPQYTPGDYLKPSPTTIAAITELPSSTTESAGYKMPSSPKVPFVDDHKRYNDIYSTTKTPIPFKMVSTSEVVSASSSRPIYQVNKNDDINIAKDSGLHLTTIPKAVTMPTTEPEVNIIIPTAKTPIIDEHKELDNGFTSHLSVEYANGYEKSSEEQSKSDGYNNPVYPVYHHETEKVNHYEQSSLSTRKPEGYTVGTSKIPFIDSHKLYENGFTPGPAIEYTNGHDKTTEIPTSKIPTDEFIQNIYPNSNYKGNDYEHLTPKVVTTTQPIYQYRPPKTTTEKPVVTQTIRYTNNYRYSDMTTKPTARYTTTTVRTSRLNNVYDIENFKCKDQDAYYSISNQCDDFIECKSGYPIQNTCPDGLHFNPAVKYGEFPCAFPSEVKCDINSVVRQPEPTSSCPRRYGYFSMQDGRCDKYIMCQEGLATIMSCPAGLAFSVATSSCDWPSNVPGCLPDAFQGFTCPDPELNEDGEPTHSILKYRYDKSCKKYIACQKGHPRLLSCDSGLAFDENSESCIDEFDVTNCT